MGGDEADDDEVAAATKIQAVHRGRKARKHRKNKKKMETQAAVKIQAAHRGRKVRKEKKKDGRKQDEGEVNAATKIQAVHRGRKARRSTAKRRKAERDKETHSATKIQAMHRGRLARKKKPNKIKPTNEEVTAATKIQAAHRGRKSRKKERGNTAAGGERDEEVVAATKIQAVHRGRKARREHLGNGKAQEGGSAGENMEDEENMTPNQSAGKSDSIKPRSAAEIICSLNDPKSILSPRVPAWIMEDAEKMNNMGAFITRSKRNFLKELRTRGKTAHFPGRQGVMEDSQFWNKTWPLLEERGWCKDSEGLFFPPAATKIGPLKENEVEKPEIVNMSEEELSLLESRTVVRAKRSRNNFIMSRVYGGYGRLIYNVDWNVGVPVHNTVVKQNAKGDVYVLVGNVYLYNEADGILSVRWPSGRESELLIGRDTFTLKGTNAGPKKDARYSRVKRRLQGLQKLNHTSAKSIQSVFRGFNSRSRTNPHLIAAKLQRAKIRGAMCIQSAYRGFCTRRSYKAQLDKLREDRRIRKDKRLKEQRKRAARREKNRAARKVQARARGVLARMSYAEFRETNIKAANTIARSYHSHVARKIKKTGGIEAVFKHAKERAKKKKKAKEKHDKQIRKMKTKAKAIEAASPVKKSKAEMEKAHDERLEASIELAENAPKDVPAAEPEQADIEPAAEQRQQGVEQQKGVSKKLQLSAIENTGSKATLPKLGAIKADSNAEAATDQEGRADDPDADDFDDDFLPRKRKKKVEEPDSKRYESVYIPVDDVDKSDRLANENKTKLLDQVSLSATLLAYECESYITVSVPKDIADAVKSRKIRTRRNDQIVPSRSGLVPAVFATRIYTGRNSCRFAVLVHMKGGEKTERHQILNVLLTDSEKAGEDSVAYVYYVIGKSFEEGDHEGLERRYVRLREDFEDRKRRNGKWVRLAKFVSATAALYGLSSGSRQHRMSKAPDMDFKFSRRATLHSSQAKESKRRHRHGVMGLEPPKLWYPDQYLLPGRTLQVDFTVTKEDVIKTAVPNWGNSDVSKFRDSLEKLRSTLSDGDEAMLRVLDSFYEDKNSGVGEQADGTTTDTVDPAFVIKEVINEIISKLGNENAAPAIGKEGTGGNVLGTETSEDYAVDFSKIPHTRGKLEHVFKLFDEDGSGYINVYEFRKFVKMILPKLPEQMMNGLVAFFDQNSDGKIDFEEFADATLGNASMSAQDLQQSYAQKPQPLLLAMAIVYDAACLSTINVVKFSICNPLKCAWHPPRGLGRPFEDICTIPPAPQKASVHMKLRKIASEGTRRLISTSAVSIEWVVDVYTFGEDGKASWKIGRATSYEGFTRSLYVEQLGNFDLGVLKVGKSHNRKVLAGESVVPCACGKNVQVRERIDTGRIRLVRPKDRASVKLFEKLYSLYMTEELVTAAAEKRPPPRLDGTYDESLDAIENEGDDDLGSDEDDFSTDENEVMEEIVVRWQAYEHVSRGSHLKNILITKFIRDKTYKNEPPVEMVKGYDVQEPSVEKTFFLEDTTDSTILACIELREPRQDDEHAELFNNVKSKYEFSYESSEDEYVSTDSEEYRVPDEDNEGKGGENIESDFSTDDDNDSLRSTSEEDAIDEKDTLETIPEDEESHKSEEKVDENAQYERKDEDTPMKPKDTPQETAEMETSELDEIEAAKKIQAVTRGRKARKGLKESEAGTSKKKDEENVSNGQEEAAARKIQAVARGRKTRKHLDKKKKGTTGEANVSPTNDAPSGEKKKTAEAAVKIQAVARGRKARKSKKKENKKKISN